VVLVVVTGVVMVGIAVIPFDVVGNIRVVVVNAVRDVLADIEGIVEVVFPLVVAGKKNIVGSHVYDLSNTKRMTTKTQIPGT
jgi:hypothetical protein